MNSIIETKLPQLSYLNQTMFENSPILFEKFYKGICQTIGRELMQLPIGPQLNNMIKELQQKISLLMADQTFLKFKAYSTNNLVLMEINRDQQTKERMDKLIEITRSNVYEFTILKAKAHAEYLQNFYMDYMQRTFKDVTAFLDIHKLNVKNINEEIDSYFMRSKIYNSPTSNKLCECETLNNKSLMAFSYAGGVYEEAKEGILFNQVLN